MPELPRTALEQIGAPECQNFSAGLPELQILELSRRALGQSSRTNQSSRVPEIQRRVSRALIQVRALEIGDQ